MERDTGVDGNCEFWIDIYTAAVHDYSPLLFVI